ncbi:MAG: CinA family protein [Candidatus Gygaella obscura]|nr:CinA family protein [Candidatus Gygaella obscura]
MKTAILKVHNLLINKKESISVSESCTGGMLSSMLTSLPGSSGYFKSGIITYSNQSKTKLLKVAKLLIKKYGAVSEQVALAMAKNTKKIADTDIAVAITGIAGPAGATPGKDIGTVFIAISYKNKLTCKKFSFKGTRTIIRKKSCLKTIQLLYLLIKSKK